MRESSIPEDLQDISKNIDMDEVFSSFMPSLDCQLTSIESGLRNDLKVLKQMRKVFNDLSQEMNSKVSKPCEKIKQPSTTDKAKEEATKLLKSGAISFDTSHDKHVFKRKFRESDSASMEYEELRTNKNKKLNLYDNFISGEKTKSSFTSLPNDNNTLENTHNTELFERAENTLDPCSVLNNSRSWDAKFKETISLSHSFYSPHNDGSRKQSGSTIYISCNDISESIIREILDPFGPIHHIRLDERKCYAFVTLQSSEEAENALKLDRTMFGNRRLRINYARRQFRPQTEWDHLASDGLPHRAPNTEKQQKCDPHPSQSSEKGSRNLVTYEDVDY